MKKLMLTTAIASVLTTAAIAQTTITGELRVNYKAVGSEAATGTTATSARGFGNEAQINFQTKGKLNVGGLDYAAGFAMENDGAQATALFNENTYMDFTNASSGTTISLSQDHIQRSDSDRSAAVLVGFSPNELATSGPSGNRFAQNLGPAVGASWGIAVLQATPYGTFSYNYAPTLTDNSTTVTTTGGAASENALAESDRESGYEYGFVGGLGVKGLNAYYFKSAENSASTITAATPGTIKSEAKSWGANYNFGQVTVGFAKKDYNPAGTTANTTAPEITEKHYGVAYAVNNAVTIAALWAKADLDGNANTQEVKALQLGYALGPVDLTASVARNTDVGGVLGADSDMAMIRFIGKF
jgi:hypothetical protein